MPKDDSIFLLANLSRPTTFTGQATGGVNFYAPVPCDIISADYTQFSGGTADVLTIFVYPISAASGPVTAGAAVTVVASPMFSFSSADYGSFANNTLRQLTVPTDSSSVGRHLNKGDGIQIAVTTGGTVANIVGTVINIWAKPKR